MAMISLLLFYKCTFKCLCISLVSSNCRWVTSQLRYDQWQMLGLVTLYHTTVDGQSNPCLDIKKPLQWCSVASFPLMLTSMIFLVIDYFKSNFIFKICALHVAGTLSVVVVGFRSCVMHWRSCNSMMLH